MGLDSNQDNHSSYDAAFFGPLYAVENKHFWFRSRNLIISRLVQQLAREFQAGAQVLEIGCGTGNTLAVLNREWTKGPVTGVDLFYDGLKFARQRVDCRFVQGDINELPFPAGTFDLICLFDVLEHLPADTEILRSLHDLLTPNGLLMLTVPAHMSLWSYFDEASKHCRRYEVGELETKLTQTGFHIDYLTHYMASIYPLVKVGRWLASAGRRQKTTRTDEQARDLAFRELKIVPVVNELLTALLSQETRFMMRRRKLPIGTSLLAIARK